MEGYHLGGGELLHIFFHPVSRPEYKGVVKTLNPAPPLSPTVASPISTWYNNLRWSVS